MAWPILLPIFIQRITGLDAAGVTLREIAAATGVSTFSVRNALGRVAAGGQAAADDSAGPVTCDGDWDRAGFGCCRTRCPATGSGRWHGGGCWARARSRCSPPVPN
jgi:hypothetical protein